jgi:hypothetical protein
MKEKAVFYGKFITVNQKISSKYQYFFATVGATAECARKRKHGTSLLN